MQPVLQLLKQKARLLLYAIKLFIGVPPRIEQLVWVIVLILCLIYALTLLAGGGGSVPFRLGH